MKYQQISTDPKAELEQLNHELRNACLAIEALLKRMNRACKKYEEELEDDADCLD